MTVLVTSVKMKRYFVGTCGLVFLFAGAFGLAAVDVFLGASDFVAATLPSALGVVAFAFVALGAVVFAVADVVVGFLAAVEVFFVAVFGLTVAAGARDPFLALAT